MTPSSKVVGDFAQFMVSNKLSKQDVIDRADKLDFPESVVEFFQGHLGQPYGGFPEPLRSLIIRDRQPIDKRPGLTMAPLNFKKIKAELREKYGKTITDTDVNSYAMYPKVFAEFRTFVEKYGDLSVVPTRFFLAKPQIGEEMQITIEQGKMLLIRLLAVGPIDLEKGTRECCEYKAGSI